MKKNKLNWVKTDVGNVVLEFSGGYISYNPNVGSSELGEAFKSFGYVLGLESSKKETALKIEGVWYILNGDFRKDYEKLLSKGAVAMVKFYKSKKKEFGSFWSTD